MLGRCFFASMLGLLALLCAGCPDKKEASGTSRAAAESVAPAAAAPAPAGSAHDDDDDDDKAEKGDKKQGGW